MNVFLQPTAATKTIISKKADNFIMTFQYIRNKYFMTTVTQVESIKERFRVSYHIYMDAIYSFVSTDVVT